MKRSLPWLLALALTLSSTWVYSQESKNLAPGFSTRAANSKLTVVPLDIELFTISAGGLVEPKADWTTAAQKHVRDALDARKEMLGARAADLVDADLDQLAEFHTLHRAVTSAILLHHVMGGPWKLATKNEQLDWSMGEAVKPLRDKSGADYALVIWIRDTYASPERKATMLAMALLRVPLFGGTQHGYASLVDLATGRIVWINVLDRLAGDLREAQPALETVEALLSGFPGIQ